MKYKFLRLVENNIKSYNGNKKWEVGKWYKEEKLDMCNKGFHCSNKILDAMGYVQGEILAEVETRGNFDSQYNKEVWQEMRITKAYKWIKKDSVALAIFSAELVIKNYKKEYPDDDRPRKAIEAAKKVLKNDNEENRSAAKLVARSVESAAEAAWLVKSAAQSAAWTATWTAAWSAAQQSAQSAAWLAAWLVKSVAEKINKKIEKWLVSHIKELEVEE